MAKKYTYSNCMWEQLYNIQSVPMKHIYFNCGSYDLSNKIFAILCSNICWIIIIKERQSVFEITLFGIKLTLRVQWQILLK